MFLETLEVELLERTSKNEANSFFDVLSCISIEGPMVHLIIGFIFLCYFLHFYWWSNGPLAGRLHFLMPFHVI